jgi:hypothetical protein
MKKQLRKLAAMAVTAVMAVSAMNVNVLAYIENKGYKNATEISLKQTISTDKIISATDEKWYKITTQQPNMTYSLTLSNMPSSSAYGYEMRYQESADARPIIMNNAGKINSTGGLVMHGFLRNTGSYYVRVFSATGEYSSTPYTLTVNVSNAMKVSTTNIKEIKADSSKDWAACAEMMGNCIYKHHYGAYTSRNYMNAMQFVNTNGTSEKASSAPTMRKPAIDKVAMAANYIYAGDFTQSPMFAVEEKMYTSADFLESVWALSNVDYARPVIIKLNDVDAPTSNVLSRYLLVIGADATNNRLRVVQPETGTATSIDYTTLVTDGYEYTTYSGENVVRIGY